jgi:hypothetical protein
MSKIPIFIVDAFTPKPFGEFISQLHFIILLSNHIIIYIFLKVFINRDLSYTYLY